MIQLKSKTMPKKIFVDSTDYCEEGKLDTQKLINLIKTSKSSKNICTNDFREADIILYRACGHIQAREDYSISDITRLLSLKKSDAELIVWGCLPKINPAALKNIYQGPLVGPEECWDFFYDFLNIPKEKNLIVANTLNKHCITETAKKTVVTSRFRKFYDFFADKQDAIFNFKKKLITKNLWYIKIVHGCKNSCTYCSDRGAYTTVRSYEIQEIVKQFEQGLSLGYRNFFFVGRDLGSYGYDTGSNLAELLDEIVRIKTEVDYKIFITNVAPNSLVSLFPDLKRVLATGKIAFLGSHIQSGSKRILKLMGKTVSLNRWIETIKAIKKHYPKVKLETSIMVGFPSETDDDFRRTMDLVNDLMLDRIVLYQYNERPNIPARRIREKVPKKISVRRYNQMYQQLTFCKIKKMLKQPQFFSMSDLSTFFDIITILLRKLARDTFDKERLKSATRSQRVIHDEIVQAIND